MEKGMNRRCNIHISTLPIGVSRHHTIPTNPTHEKGTICEDKAFNPFKRRQTVQVPTEILVAMITSGAAMIASVIGALLNYETNQKQHERDAKDHAYREKQNARDEKRDLIEKERAFIYDALLKGTAASLQANKISLIALQHGHLNGNVEEARRIVDEAQNDLEAAQRKAVAHITTA